MTTLCVGVGVGVVLAGREVAMRHVLFIGDSQCEFLNSGNLYANFATALAAKLRTNVNVVFDCQGWRRFSSCHQSPFSPAEPLCHSAVDTMNDYCERQTDTLFTDIVYMVRARTKFAEPS